MAAQHLSVSDLVFSEQANHNFSRILGDLKRSNLGVGNRLRSVVDDARFVAGAAAAQGRPLVANERCGSWYVEPRLKAASAYFKSTDGHAGQWSFSTRRLNLHLLPLIGRCDGCIIVDSTRRGKRIPDALSKTVPIWCCVLNRALFPDLPESQRGLFVPPNAVSDSERSQMLARVPDFVASLERLGLDLTSLAAQLKKPLRPMWINRPEDGGGGGGGGGGDDHPLAPLSAASVIPADVGSSTSNDGDGDGHPLPPVVEVFEAFHPVICCTSSRRVAGAEMSESGYIQGAGDDTENWAHGLTPPVFWANAARLLAAPEAELPSLIRGLVAEAPPVDAAAAAAAVRHLTPFLSVSALPVPADHDAPAAAAAAATALPEPRTTTTTTTTTHLTISLLPRVTKAETWAKSPTTLEVGLGKGKIASRNLRQALPDICAFVQKAAAAAAAAQEGGSAASVRVLVACESGRDVSVGVALALACRCFDDRGDVLPAAATTTTTAQQDAARSPGPTKDFIRTKLGRIVTAMPEANPSRATLQSVNSFLMGWRE
ncbi:hypothetical protein RB594_001815 [Gaeumannomyces avenae]